MWKHYPGHLWYTNPSVSRVAHSLPPGPSPLVQPCGSPWVLGYLYYHQMMTQTHGPLDLTGHGLSALIGSV